jgi:hypothetical protein
MLKSIVGMMLNCVHVRRDFSRPIVGPCRRPDFADVARSSAAFQIEDVMTKVRPDIQENRLQIGM